MFEKKRKKEAKRIFEDIGEEPIKRTMSEITPILKHFQDVLTRKVPSDPIPRSQEDDQYYEYQLELKNIHGRPEGEKIKITEIPQDLKSLKVNPREDADPHQK
ncbi:hypothetical protein O181_011847 [Austropuccinia psidii MF-1]|uniref:Uncharacterized protein n=1 Tax=Austropuccinia psidii MF-1 TaxID=1389203 RepID=A0A9Q3BVB4_9BASI|nr:hypothetical protein [Austropuccinia psidii MF-1]